MHIRQTPNNETLANAPLQARSPVAGRPSLPDLIRVYGGRAPRYTSYPTAAQFSLDVNGESQADWLGRIAPDKPVSVYVHIPFCTRLCWFCGCNTRAISRASVVSDYVRTLNLEAALIEPLLPAHLTANALHLGGGTPNMLSAADLDALFTMVRRVFRLSPEAKIAAELDPASLTQDWVQAAARHGLNRASLGVQDLSPHVQAAVNRREDFACIAQAVRWLREADVSSVNLDLMYGLPRQTCEDLLTTVDQVATLRPDRIALFGYAHVPWMKAHQKLIRDEELPDAMARLEQSNAASERLAQVGYVAIGLDHFALPGDELAKAAEHGGLHRNFQGYTTDEAQTLIGIGASAISSFPQGYLQNQSNELIWRQCLAAGKSPVARGLALTEEDAFRADIIERLMCDFEVNLEAACARHGRTTAVLDDEVARLRTLQRDGLVKWSDSSLTVTPAGRPFVRSVCAVFDHHLEHGAVRHAPAV